MSRLRLEEIERMFVEFGLSSDEDRQVYRDLATLGLTEETREEFTKIDSTTGPVQEAPHDAELA